jgi:phosphopantothenoylcysteine synthetase/decarboxylase
VRGRRVIVTSGPTIEPIDPVRFLSNRSSGRQGHAIAAAFAALKADVTLVSGPVAIPDPEGVTTIHVETARQMLEAVTAALPADVFVGVAAVADWRPAETAARKLKGEKGAMASLTLTENPDILKTVAGLMRDRPALVIGFAAETHDVERHAREKLARKGCDWIVANDVSGDAMGGAENAAMLIGPDRAEHWPRAPKAEIAWRLAEAADLALGAP